MRSYVNRVCLESIVQRRSRAVDEVADAVDGEYEPGVVVRSDLLGRSTVSAMLLPLVPSWKAPWERSAMESASSPVKNVSPPEPVWVKPK